MTMPTEAQIRLTCLELAVRTPGMPNVVTTANTYHEWVTQGLKEPEQTQNEPATRKGTRK